MMLEGPGGLGQDLLSGVQHTVDSQSPNLNPAHKWALGRVQPPVLLSQSSAGSISLLGVFVHNRAQPSLFLQSPVALKESKQNLIATTLKRLAPRAVFQGRVGP